jgi:tetratricopeptide (TPR) repeat protein
MAAFQLQDTPDEGRIDDERSVPLLLARAWRDRRDGCLLLERGNDGLSVEVRAGAPVAIRFPAGEDRFAVFLEETKRITAPQRADVERLATQRSCPQASAALALKLLAPSRLYEALREHQRTRLAASFEWREGCYRWSPIGSEASSSASRPFDLLALLQRELPRRWDSDRLFSALAAVQDACGDIAPGDRKIARKLAGEGEAAARAMQRLDGSTTLGQVLGGCAGEPLAAATLWTVIQTGVLRLGERSSSWPGTGPAMDFEVEIRGTPATDAAASGAGESGAHDARSDGRGDSLREEIEQLIGRLGDLDHYTALGLETDAKAAQIKKAYFKAAKRYHPDALARLGLDDLKEPAARVFARIAEAFETLSDPDKKQAYDEGGGDATQIDTARLARAETSFRKGEILVKMGNFGSALEYLESAVELWPEEPAYHALLGWALHKQQKADPARAAQHLERALAGAGDDALIHFRLGLVLRALGEGERAEALIARARSLEPRVQA